MRCTRNREDFLKLSKLFRIKYQGKHPDFVAYFEKEWVDAHPNWFLGVSNFSPSTNNALESFNGKLKSNCTMRKILPIKTFCIKLFEWVRTWGLKYSSGEKKFIQTVPVSKQLWLEAKQFALVDKVIKKTSSDENFNTFIVPAGSRNDVLSLLRTDFESFDDFRDKYFTFYVVKMPVVANEANFLMGTCDCPQFLKKYVCKHTLAVALRLKLVKVPLTACSEKLPSKKGPGRPQNAKKALQKQ